jgi:CHAT domain-containing protein
MRYISAVVISAVVLTMGLPRAAESQAQVPSAKSDVGDRAAIEKAREKLKLAEAAHPEGSLEVSEAIYQLVYAMMMNEQVNAESFALVEKELVLAQKFAEPESLDFVDACIQKSNLLSYSNKNAEARPIVENALEIIRKKFPDREELPRADTLLLHICLRLGDFQCGLRAADESIDAIRKGAGDASSLYLTLSQRAELKFFLKDMDGAVSDIEEALAIAYKNNTSDFGLGVLERNLADMYIRAQKLDQAMPHLVRARELITKAQGAESPELKTIDGLEANLFTRTGQFEKAWNSYLSALGNKNDSPDNLTAYRAALARSYAAGGKLNAAVEQGLQVEKTGRETFVLEARSLPEREALAYNSHRAKGLDVALSVLGRHPEMPSAAIYQEMVRSRALVADEMARRQKNLNANNDPEVTRLLGDMDKARADLLALEKATPDQQQTGNAVVEATSRMEKIERALAERSAAARDDEHATAVRLEDLRQNLPVHSALISYVLYQRLSVEKVDPAMTRTPAYMAFVLRPGSDRIDVFDLGDAAPLDELVRKARAAADAEAHGGGLGSTRNERAYREAALAIRQRIWDPLKKEIGDAKLALVVADGNLNLIPFAGLPDGAGYLVEHEPVIHMLSSERDLLPADQGQKKSGLLAIGSPSFELAENRLPPSPLRGATPNCEEFGKIEFQPLPATALEVSDIGSTWRRWNGAERSQLVTGDDATLTRFIEDAPKSRVLHVATHAFLLDKSCGSGNPLLHSGLVFAGGSHGGAQSILTAQQIASFDLSGMDWAVLSACNTGNGELRDGEGVLGLQRSFRVAGAHSIIMTLWPVDDDVTRQFMHELYAERLGQHASTADAVWTSARKLLRERRAAGKSTHPWYWAGFVGSGAWE